MGENYEYSASIREFTTETLSKWSLVFLCELGSSAVSFDIPPLDTRFALLGVTACPEQAAQPRIEGALLRMTKNLDAAR
ncbi:MAG TPA: hypothetical protein VGH22_02735 [Candidatus Binatia bacterium]|jgi:hypothetical protein